MANKSKNNHHVCSTTNQLRCARDRCNNQCETIGITRFKPKEPEENEEEEDEDEVGGEGERSSYLNRRNNVVSSNRSLQLKGATLQSNEKYLLNVRNWRRRRRKMPNEKSYNIKASSITIAISNPYLDSRRRRRETKVVKQTLKQQNILQTKSQPLSTQSISLLITVMIIILCSIVNQTKGNDDDYLLQSSSLSLNYPSSSSYFNGYNKGDDRKDLDVVIENLLAKNHHHHSDYYYYQQRKRSLLQKENVKPKKEVTLPFLLGGVSAEAATITASDDDGATANNVIYVKVGKFLVSKHNNCCCIYISN